MYPKVDPTPVTSSAPPVSTLYTPPVVRPLLLLPFSLAQLIIYHTKLCFALLNKLIADY